MPIARSLKTLKTRVFSAFTPQLGALSGTPMVYMQDGINVDGLQPGFPAYGGYYNGTYANLTAMRQRFPNAYILSITPNGANGAMCIDIEPGDAIPANAPGFWHNSDHGGAVKPWFYGSASWCQSIIDNLSAAGIPRSAYFIWSAHYIGVHMCGPGTCGYAQADATQYQSTQNYDQSLVAAYCFGTAPVPPPSEPTIAEGSTNKAAVEKARILLDSHNAKFPPNADGNDWTFGPVVKKAVEAFQSVNKLQVDGIIGPVTWTALENKNSKPIPNVGPPPVPPTPAPKALTVSDYVTATVSWDVIPGASKYVVLVSQQDGKVMSQTVSTNAAEVSVHRGWVYTVTVRADVAGAEMAKYILSV